MRFSTIIATTFIAFVTTSIASPIAIADTAAMAEPNANIGKRTAGCTNHEKSAAHSGECDESTGSGGSGSGGSGSGGSGSGSTSDNCGGPCAADRGPPK